MKDLEHYEDYIDYLNWQLTEKKINKGEFALLKISKSNYNIFMKDIDNKLNNVLKSYKRDVKIEKVIEEIEEPEISDIDFDEIDDFFDGLEI